MTYKSKFVLSREIALKHLLHILSFLLCPLSVFTQQYYIKGQVKDETGHSLQNVSIYVHSNGYLYYTGGEGAFGILTNKQLDTITFSYKGYQTQKLAIDAKIPVEVTLTKTAITKNTQGYQLASLTRNLKKEIQQQWLVGDETYASLVENQFITVAHYPTTGITLNVDRASYSNIRRFLNMNMLVPPDAVRMEEMLNYFNFGYTEPLQNKIFDIKTTLTQCPWNKEHQLLYAQILSKRIDTDNLPASHLVFLIDISGSMDMPNRLPLLKSSFKTLVNNLRPIDSVTIVVYGGVVGVALPATSGDQKEVILKTIDSLQAGGSTPGESGIRLAYAEARNHFIKDGNNRIILATDGDFNVGLKKEEDLEEMIALEKKQGIYLTCLGIGMGNYKDSKIQTLAQRGNGNFAYLDSYAEAEKVLLKEFTQTLYAVADDACLNVQFNPAYISEYRLIGFDNKMGAIKDETAIIEGGEIGPAYSALIAFEITPTAGKNTKQDSLVSFTLEYKLPGSNTIDKITETPTLQLQPFSTVSPPYQFASAVIMFGSLLRKSKFTKDITWNTVLEIATHAVDTTSYSQKEFLKLVQQAKNLYNKKRN